MRQNIVLVALSALTVVTAQNQGQNFTIDESLVDPGLKGMHFHPHRILEAELTMDG
jgi:hypothetical protein